MLPSSPLGVADCPGVLSQMPAPGLNHWSTFKPWCPRALSQALIVPRREIPNSRVTGVGSGWARDFSPSQKTQPPLKEVGTSRVH